SHAVPARIEDLRRRIDAFEVERRILVREQASGEDHRDRLARIEGELATANAEHASLEKRWEQERELASAIQKLRLELEAAAADGGSTAAGNARSGQAPEALINELERKKAELAVLQGDAPLVMLDVDGQAIAEVIESWTGIPMGKMMADEIRSVLQLADTLKQRVIGQDHGLATIARRVHTARANLDNPAKPIGVFLLVGPSGVGKTESALALAEALYGGERNLITINMSEYQEAHTVSSLKGSPPGYVGYGEGGVLTEAVRRKPYSVILFDEIEKAHHDVFNVLLQILDDGRVTDSQGHTVDFKNTVVIMTSNVGSPNLIEGLTDRGEITEGARDAVMRELRLQFRPEFLNRVDDVVLFKPLRLDEIQQIVELLIQDLRDRLVDRGVTLRMSDAARELIAREGYDPVFGARPLKRYLQHQLETRIGRALIAGEAGEGAVVDVGVRDGTLEVAIVPAGASVSA
ncbi:MAG TPA: AAA family ATPase, partial [Thermoanaerobaculia bacterium]